MREQITSGTASECLKDFFQRFGKADELWKFVQVGSRATDRWRLNGLVPRGETMLRIYYFLELVGYKVKELEEMSPELYNIGKCISFDTISAAAVNNELGLCDRFILKCLMCGQTITEKSIAVLKAVSDRHMPTVEELVIKKRQEFGTILISVKSPTLPNVVGEDDIINEFSDACARVREVGSILLNGDSKRRFEMRRRMANGNIPNLHLTWETLNNLLNERM